MTEIRSIVILTGAGGGWTRGGRAADNSDPCRQTKLRLG